MNINIVWWVKAGEMFDRVYEETKKSMGESIAFLNQNLEPGQVLVNNEIVWQLFCAKDKNGKCVPPSQAVGKLDNYKNLNIIFEIFGNPGANWGNIKFSSLKKGAPEPQTYNVSRRTAIMLLPRLLTPYLKTSEAVETEWAKDKAKVYIGLFGIGYYPAPKWDPPLRQGIPKVLTGVELDELKETLLLCSRSKEKEKEWDP